VLPRLIFFDLDGTLLASGAVLRRRTIAAVQAAAAAGATIALATGGFTARTGLIADLLGAGAAGHVWRIAHNGAAVSDPTGLLVHSQATPPAAVAAVLAAAGPRLWVTFETADPAGQTHAYYAGRLRPELAHLIWGPQPDPWIEDDPAGVPTGLEPRWDWRRARRAPHEPGSSVLGCWCIGTPRALASLDALAPRQQLCGARYLAWGKRLGQILDRPRLQLDGRDVGALRASKGAASEWLCRHLGVDLSEAAAFGDSDNDLDLLERVGVPVAMANATHGALTRAKIVAPTNDEDGVAVVLERWLGSRG
jgi:hypothetical protein